MITSEDVKESIAKKLLKIAPKVVLYKEAMSNPKFPHFFINQITLNDVEDRKNYHILTYSMDVRYRVKSDPSTDLTLQQDLDEMSFRLLQNFNLLEFNNSQVRCTNKKTEKVDGVLHFFFDIDLYAYSKSKEDYAKMNKLNYEIGVKK